MSRQVNCGKGSAAAVAAACLPSVAVGSWRLHLAPTVPTRREKLSNLLPCEFGKAHSDAGSCGLIC